MQIQLVHSDYLIDTAECTNAGAACYGCPASQHCDNCPDELED